MATYSIPTGLPGLKASISIVNDMATMTVAYNDLLLQGQHKPMVTGEDEAIASPDDPIDLALMAETAVMDARASLESIEPRSLQMFDLVTKHWLGALKCPDVQEAKLENTWRSVQVQTA